MIMDNSRNGRWTVPFKRFSRLRVNTIVIYEQYLLGTKNLKTSYKISGCYVKIDDKKSLDCQTALYLIFPVNFISHF